jgi:protein-tyrosine phosphatase
MHRIESIGRGFLAVMPHPASRGDPARVIAQLAVQGIVEVVSLLEAGEAQSLGLAGEAGLVRAESMRYRSFPLVDLGLPESVDDFARLAQALYRQVESGDNTVIHCRAGVGRSGLLAAAVLMQTGLDAQAAFARVAHRRGMPVPETPQQGAWLATHQSRLRGPVAGQGVTAEPTS